MDACAAAGLCIDRPPRALTARPDLLAIEAAHVADAGITWGDRLRELRGYGLPGSAPAARDRKAIVRWLAMVERRA